MWAEGGRAFTSAGCGAAPNTCNACSATVDVSASTPPRTSEKLLEARPRMLLEPPPVFAIGGASSVAVIRAGVEKVGVANGGGVPTGCELITCGSRL